MSCFLFLVFLSAADPRCPAEVCPFEEDADTRNRSSFYVRSIDPLTSEAGRHIRNAQITLIAGIATRPNFNSDRY